MLSTPAVAYTGAFMIRRIVGIAGVAELRGLGDEVVRAACEARALAFGQVLLKQVCLKGPGMGSDGGLGQR